MAINIIVIHRQGIILMDKENRKLDRNLRKMTGRIDKLYVDIGIVYIGDVFQIPSKGNTALYHNVNLQWSSVNTVIYLENLHRFKNDPERGKLLSQLRVGIYTEQDIEK